MGFIAGKNTIITSDWEIDKKCVMTPRQKSESISFYKENESIQHLPLESAQLKIIN